MSVTTTSAPDTTSGQVVPRPSTSRVVPVTMVVVGILLALIPFIDVTVPGLFGGDLSSPGTLQVLAVGLVFAGVAMSYDLLLGYTGLLSLGHALWFALGLYGTNLLMRLTALSYVPAVVVALLITAVVATLIGSVALRVRGGRLRDGHARVRRGVPRPDRVRPRSDLRR